MLADQNNVIGFNSKSFYTALNSILNDIKEESENTHKNYLGTYRNFFQFILGKSLDNISWDDIKKIDFPTIQNYVDHLKKKSKLPTVKAKIAALNTLYDRLHSWDNSINKELFGQLKKIKITSQIKKEGRYGALTISEVNKLLKFASEQKCKGRENFGLEQKLFFEFALTLAIRKESILSLKWENIMKVLDKNSGEEVWVVYGYEKRKDIEKAINEDFFNRLSELKNKETKQTDYVFNICEQTLRKTLKDFCAENGIGENRKIKIHSLKKTSGDRTFDMTGGNIKLTADQLQHSDINTTYNDYLGQNMSYTEQPSFFLNFDEVNAIDTIKLDEYTKEQLIEAISKCNKNIINQICKNIEK